VLLAALLMQPDPNLLILRCGRSAAIRDYHAQKYSCAEPLLAPTMGVLAAPFLKFAP
jgi:hypothetical protein